MATTALSRRKGTATQHESFAGINGEISVLVDDQGKAIGVRLHDGVTPGGKDIGGKVVEFTSFADMVSGVSTGSVESRTLGYYADTPGVGASTYALTSEVGTPGDTDGGSYFIGQDGFKRVLVHDGEVRLEQFGVRSDTPAEYLVRTACNSIPEVTSVTTSLPSLIFNRVNFIDRDNLVVDLKNVPISWVGNYDVYDEFGGLTLDNSRIIGTFYSKGSLTGGEEATSTTIVDGTRVLAVASGASYQQGQFVCLKIKYPRRAPFVRVVARVVEIIGNNLTLDYTFAWSADSCTIQPVNVRKNVTVKNFNFVDNSGALDAVLENKVSGVGFQYAYNCNTENVTGENYSYPLNITKFCHSCNQINPVGVRPRFTEAGNGYTVQINESIFCETINPVGEQVRHVIDYTGGGYNKVIKGRAIRSTLTSQYSFHGMYEHDIEMVDCQQFQGGNSIAIADSGAAFGEATKRLVIDGGVFSGRVKSQNGTDLTFKGGVDFRYGGYETNEIELGCNGDLRIEDVKFPFNTLVRARPRGSNPEPIGDIYISRTLMPEEFRFTFHTGRVFIDDCEITKLANSSAPRSKSIKVTGGKVNLMSSWRITTDESVRFDGVDIIQASGVSNARVVGEAVSVCASDCDFYNGAGFFGSGSIVKSFVLDGCKSISPDAGATSSQFVMEDTTDAGMGVSNSVLLANDAAVPASYAIDVVGVSASNANATLIIGDSYIEGRVRQEPNLPNSVRVSNSKFKENELSNNYTRTATGTTYTVEKADEGATLVFTNAGAVSVTVDAGLPIGFEVYYAKPTDAGNVTVALSGGEVINGNSTLTATATVANRVIKTLRKITATVWQAS